MENQKQRHFFCNDEQLKQLREKAQEYFSGKGYLSKFLRKLAEAKTILIIEGKGEFKISVK